jgi:hypothetical protein
MHKLLRNKASQSQKKKIKKASKQKFLNSSNSIAVTEKIKKNRRQKIKKINQLKLKFHRSTQSRIYSRRSQ